MSKTVHGKIYSHIIHAERPFKTKHNTNYSNMTFLNLNEKWQIKIDREMNGLRTTQFELSSTYNCVSIEQDILLADLTQQDGLLI